MTTARVSKRQYRWSSVHHDTVVLKGGLDQITPTLSLPPGFLRDVQNFEVSPVPGGGYSRIGGYERYDGRPSPSGVSFALVQVVSFTNTPTVGQTLTGFTSGATGVIIALGANYMALTKIVGTFTTSEVVKVGATTIGTATTLTTSLSSLLSAQYTALAADQYRADIGVVPGSGPIRGIVSAIFGGVDYDYAFRDNAGGTATILHVASASGWTVVPFFNEVSFTAGGVTEPADGATLTQGANTALIKRVVLQSGSWAAGTAAGRFIVATPAPGNFAAGAATIGAVAVTLSGAQTAITLTPGGKFEFSSGNFSGQLGTVRIYGCDGVNRGFEFDGTVLVPITTGTTPDAPTHVKVHKNHLFFAFASSAINSGIGFPYKWTALDGSVEHATGDTITNFLQLPGEQATAALCITGLDHTFILYGTGTSTWNLITYSSEVGALSYTAQSLSQNYWLDDAGVFSLQATLNYGNFEQATLTNAIHPFIEDKRSKVAYSSLYRSKSQYRIFFSDGTGLYMTIVNGKLLGSTKISFPDVMYCAWNGMRGNGNEAAFVGGATSGYVYQLDKGSSFDGANLDAFIVLNWNAMKSPRLLKRFRHASLEITGNFFASVSFGYALGYGTTEIDQPTAVAYDSGFATGGNWDTAGLTWETFQWDGRTLFPTETDLTGTAENLNITISSSTAYIYPYTLNSATVHYSSRRGLR